MKRDEMEKMEKEMNILKRNHKLEIEQVRKLLKDKIENLESEVEKLKKTIEINDKRYKMKLEVEMKKKIKEKTMNKEKEKESLKGDEKAKKTGNMIKKK